VLDAAAVDAVRGLRPQPFPAALPSLTLRVRLPVVFELR
jgi:outer membrane biosynthesis protein TonB